MNGGRDSGDEVVPVQRLRDVAVVASVESKLTVPGAGVRGYRNGPNLRVRAGRRPDGTNQRVTVLIRHGDIGDEDVIVLVLQGM